VASSRKLTATCPECGSDLVIDGATGEVISHRALKRPPAGGKDFDALLAGIDGDRERAEDVFARSMAAEKDRDRLLEEKFRAAMQRAEEEPDDEPPRRPFDFD